MKKNTLKNLLAENMLRFGTKNLSESDLTRIDEQQQVSLDAIDTAVEGLNKQIEAEAAKAGVTIVNHLKTTFSERAAGALGLYLVDDYNFKRPSVVSGPGKNYLGVNYSLGRPMSSPEAVQGRWFKQLAKLHKNQKTKMFARKIWPILRDTPVAGQKNIYHAIWSASGGGQEQG
jgi:hypothetical protein